MLFPLRVLLLAIAAAVVFAAALTIAGVIAGLACAP